MADSRSALTGTGVTLCSTGAALIVGGVALGWVELVATGAGLILLVLLARFSVAGELQISVHRTLHPPSLTVGESCDVHIEATNHGPRRTQAATLRDRIGHVAMDVAVPQLTSGSRYESTHSIPTDRRGVLPVGPALLVRNDALGLARRTVQGAGVDTVCIRPRVHAVRPLSSGTIRDMSGSDSRAATDGGSSFHALREYVPGDDLRHVHWRTSARTGTLMVRQEIDPRRPSIVVILDCYRSHYASDDSFELAVEVAASIGMASLANSVPLRAYAANGALHSDRAANANGVLLDRLAEVQLGDENRLDSIVELAQRRESRQSSFVIVSGVEGRNACERSRHRLRGPVIAILVSPTATAIRETTKGAVRVSSPGDFVTTWNGLVR